MSEFQDSAYLMEHDHNRFKHVERGEGYDLQAFSFDGVMQIRRVIQAKTLDLPVPTFFYQYECKNYLNKLDSLYALEGCPIFSQRMIDILLSVSEFAYKKYPIAVLKEQGDFNPYEDIEKFKDLSLRSDLFIFQTLEHLDIFDWEKSNYEQDEYEKEQNIPGYIRGFVLKTPEGGFPPLFRLPFKTSKLFVSREAREALKKEKAKGISFTSLLIPMGNSEIDVPVDFNKS
jgi:hypothetical protein